MGIGYDVISARETGTGLSERWSALQTANSATSSPFFRPEFTACVAAVRDDVHIGVLHERGTIVGILPFHRAGRLGRPVGGGRSNFHGVIGDPDLEFDARALIRACGLDVWLFDHLICSQAPFARYHRARAGSPYMDLSDGFDAYLESRRHAGSQVASATLRKTRRMEREVGPLRFTADDDDPDAMKQLLRWKSAQYRRTGVPDRFARRWNVDLLLHIQSTKGPLFSGLCSTLRAGDHLVAVHVGMRSDQVWHWWFPAFNPDFGRASPGTALLLMMAEVAPALGISRIDLGPGSEDYKNRMKSGETPLAMGAVSAPSLLAVRFAARERVKHAARRLGITSRLKRTTTTLRSGGDLA